MSQSNDRIKQGGIENKMTNMLTRIFRPTKYENDLANTIEGKLLEKFFDSGPLSYNVHLQGNIVNPPTKGTKELIRMYKRSPRFRAVVSKISSFFASIPIEAGYIKQGNKKREATYRPDIKRADYGRRTKLIEMAKQIENHPLIEMLEFGNEFFDGYQVRELWNTYMDIKGECFWGMNINGHKQPISIWPVPPHWIQKVPSKEYPYYETSYGNRSIHEDEMLWFKTLDPENPYSRGTGLGESLGDELDSDEYAAKLIKSAFYNRGRPESIISLEGAKPDTVREAEDRWDAKTRGFNKYGRPFFTGTKIDYKKLQQTFEELQMLGLRDSYRDIIMNVYGMPPEMLGIIENSNRATINSAAYIMMKFIIVPRMERYIRALTRQLVPLYDKRIILNYENPVPEDQEHKLNVMKAAPYHFTQNQWLETAGFESRGDAGEIYMVPLNIIPTEKPAEELADNAPQIDAYRSFHERQQIGMRLIQALPRYSKDTMGDQVDYVLQALVPDRIKTEIESVFSDELESWGNKKLEELGIEPSFNMLNPLVVDKMRDITGNRITLIDNTTRDAIKSSLMEGVSNGESIQQLRKRVRDEFHADTMDIKGYRTERIARTEVMGTANFGTWQVHVQSGVVQLRQWAAALVNTRDEHVELNGQVRDITMPFDVDGYKAMYPGGFGAGYLDINCMCTTVAVIEEPKDADYLGKAWKSFIGDVWPWILTAQQAYARGMAAQEKDLLARLNEVFGEE
jgi:phage portal protein BeeE